MDLGGPVVGVARQTIYLLEWHVLRDQIGHPLAPEGAGAGARATFLERAIPGRPRQPTDYPDLHLAATVGNA